jgi:agmatinase
MIFIRKCGILWRQYRCAKGISSDKHSLFLAGKLPTALAMYLFLSLPMLFLSFSFLLPISTREIIFPPLATQQRLTSQINLGSIDITDPNTFFGLPTFANLPLANCFGDKRWEPTNYDIAIMGAPFDTSVTGRPGARFGPKGIRAGSARMSPGESWSVYTGENTLASWAKIVDCGDVPLTFLDNTVALKQLDKAHRVASSRLANDTSKGEVPRILVLGGDHTTTLSALRSTYQRFGPVSVIHFDSHIDTWDPEILGGNVSVYAGVNHGTFLHIAHEEGLILNSSIHAGIRAPVSNPKKDMRNDRKCGFETVRARDIDRLGINGVTEVLKKRVGDSRVYISVDIDVLDPAFAPGRKLLPLLYALTCY